MRKLRLDWVHSRVEKGLFPELARTLWHFKCWNCHSSALCRREACEGTGFEPPIGWGTFLTYLGVATTPLSVPSAHLLPDTLQGHSMYCSCLGPYHNLLLCVCGSFLSSSPHLPGYIAFWMLYPQLLIGCPAHDRLLTNIYSHEEKKERPSKERKEGK